MARIIELNSRKEVRVVKKYTDLQQFAKITVYFADKSSSLLYKTKLNKLLFYTQFLFCKEYGKPFFGARFIRDHYGPVMEGLEYSLSALEENNFIKLESTGYGQVIQPLVTLSEQDYTKEEKSVLEKIWVQFDSYTSRRISLYSHNESLWKNTAPKDEIPLTRANELNEFV